MKLSHLAAVSLFSVAVLVTAAFADKVVTYRRADARINVVELRPLADGGIQLEANVQFPEADGGAGYAKVGTCDMTTLTSAQRTCLAGIRSKALECVADPEVGP